MAEGSAIPTTILRRSDSSDLDDPCRSPLSVVYISTQFVGWVLGSRAAIIVHALYVRTSFPYALLFRCVFLRIDFIAGSSFTHCN